MKWRKLNNNHKKYCTDLIQIGNLHDRYMHVECNVSQWKIVMKVRFQMNLKQ